MFVSFFNLCLLTPLIGYGFYFFLAGVLGWYPGAQSTCMVSFMRTREVWLVCNRRDALAFC